MRRKTVKRRIFVSNTLMVFVILAIFLIVNVLILKICTESLEREFRTSLEGIVDEESLEKQLENFTLQRTEFIFLFLADGALCGAVLLLVSQLFTKNLTEHIMKPLCALGNGAERIQKNDLSQDVAYTGEIEFENVCDAFNKMQKHILMEQEKNRKYEKARTDMIAGISHDLRTPLTAIRGTIKGLIDGIASTPEKQKEFLETAYRRTRDMDTLLNQLFYVSKLETGNMPLSLHTIELSSFIENYVEAKQEFLENDKEKLTSECNGITVNVSVDPDQLGRIFENLLENSRKYGQVVPLQMKITLSRAEKGVCICFSDNGAGVSKKKLPYLFDEFYRGDESRNRKEGNGLGLYIVRYLIEAMGGNVWAESENGFAVYMALPAVDQKEVHNG